MSFADEPHRAERVAEDVEQFGVEFVRRKRGAPLALLRRRAPDHRASIRLRQRKQRERALLREVLEGDTRRVARDEDFGEQGGLVEVQSARGRRPWVAVRADQDFVGFADEG